MTTKVTSLDRRECLQWTRFCLSGASLVSFKFDSVFSAVFQGTHGTRIVEATLAIGAPFRIGGQDLTALPGEPKQDRREQAFHFMGLVGRSVESAEVTGSDLIVTFDDDGALVISGHSDAWDFAWHIGVPTSEGNDESISIDCGSDGELFCSYDSAALGFTIPAGD